MEHPYYPNYDEFLSRATTIQVGKEWFKNNIQKLGNPKTILSIGCGAGDIDLEILQQLAPQTYIAVEPDVHMLGDFQKRVAEAKERGQFKNTNFIFIPKTLEDYEHTYGKVDLILMVQCLYYMPNRKEMLDKTMKMGDEMIFVLMSEQAGMHRLQIDLIPESKRSYKTVNSADICNVLSTLDCKCTHLGTIRATLKVDKPTEGLLEFLLEKDLEDENEKERTRKYLAEKYNDGVLPQISDIYSVTKTKQSA